MSSIASPRRTEGAAAPAFSARQLSTAAATLVLAALVISFRPFQPAGGASEGGGDIVNQLGFSAVGGLALFAMLSLAQPRKLLAMLSQWWLLTLCFLFLAALHAVDVGAGLRGAAFTLIGMVAAASVVALPRDADAFSSVLATVGLLTVGLCYAGVLLFPELGVHGANVFEPEHEGLWRGSFSHKNLAAPVMACLSFTGIYLCRRGWWKAGLLLLVLGVVFVANTGSKTTTGLVPLSIVMVALPGLFRLRGLAVGLFLFALAVAFLATLGIVFFAPLNDLAQAISPGLDYTGRTALWAFSAERIAERPWFGYGYDSFWMTPVVTGLDQSFDQDWDIRNIVHGHSGYMDVAVTMGLPALVATVMALIVQPLRDYLRVPASRENLLLADLFLMMLLFTSLNAFLESFILRRVDPVWMFCLLAAFGLRVAARFVIPTRTA